MSQSIIFKGKAGGVVHTSIEGVLERLYTVKIVDFSYQNKLHGSLPFL